MELDNEKQDNPNPHPHRKKVRTRLSDDAYTPNEIALALSEVLTDSIDETDKSEQEQATAELPQARVIESPKLRAMTELQERVESMGIHWREISPVDQKKAMANLNAAISFEAETAFAALQALEKNHETEQEFKQSFEMKKGAMQWTVIRKGEQFKQSGEKIKESKEQTEEDVEEEDDLLENLYAVLPESVAKKMSVRGRVFSCLPLTAAVIEIIEYLNVPFYESEPNTVAVVVSTICLLLMAPLFAFYGTFSVSWEKHRESSLLGMKEFQENTSLFWKTFNQMLLWRRPDLHVDDDFPL
mmetsp:Transcript_32034/g.51760  ORF Transcript_32034/g.51760 Transcript_32034/m.51760 type:complete len:300 (+) Transcript_32034:257-1156(+)|eukprot:CAMPEP_0184651582 /NCGR_PEP_ID=MMETSP0308-20130426/9230_1 /TAXON_ID=38269 /ORGANISM="Gloeochaete witrockiana, Strain SAG 46.84" /LENGTH=299 /DNA_ID=CAMNT_0027085925 /DNA_START=260 /DNA_END=1159 /DNA_ORIENTATION=-